MPRRKPGKKERQERRELRKKALLCHSLTPIEIQLNESNLPLTPRVLENENYFCFPENNKTQPTKVENIILTKELAIKFKNLFGDDDDSHPI